MPSGTIASGFSHVLFLLVHSSILLFLKIITVLPKEKGTSVVRNKEKSESGMRKYVSWPSGSSMYGKTLVLFNSSLQSP